ncbi:MAG: hypothetical protein ACD_62C00339G0011 [uncultured bacterium]|nr:MAG: hypothetical protein ACD_62C00339G0011 [uncultured bacterium]HLD44532.1 hypothetical protein [bacterium]
MKKWFLLLFVSCFLLYKYVLPKIDAEISQGYYEDWGQPQQEVKKEGTWDKAKKFFENLFTDKNKKEKFIYK